MEMLAAPIQLFGGWLRTWETSISRYPEYWVGGRCALGCHKIVVAVHGELVGTDYMAGYWKHLRNDLIMRLALAHATGSG